MHAIEFTSLRFLPARLFIFLDPRDATTEEAKFSPAYVFPCCLSEQPPRLWSESYNEIYAWNQSCTRVLGSFTTFGVLPYPMMQKDTSKESDAGSSYYSRYEKEDRCIIQWTHTKHTGYGKHFLFLQTLLAWESGANLSCSYMNGV